MHDSMNGNGGIPPPTPKLEIVSSRSLRHRRLSKLQKAAILAQVLEGERGYVPTQHELACSQDVPDGYISAARARSPAKRQMLADGKGSTKVAALLSLPKPAPTSAPSPVIDHAKIVPVTREAGNGHAPDVTTAAVSNAAAEDTAVGNAA